MLAEDRLVGSLERMLHLGKVPIVGTLPPHQLAVIAEAAQPRVYRAGDVLLREDERVTAASFIVEGSVRLTRGDRHIATLVAGQALGGIGLLDPITATWSAVAETDTLVLEVDADTFLDLIEDHFEILRHLLRETSRHVIESWRALPPGTPPIMNTLRPLEPREGRDLDLVERIFLLRQVVPFERASINALAELARGFSEVRLQPGERLWQEGDAARHVMLLVDGVVRCESRSGFNLLGQPGMPLGALEAVAGVPRWYDAVVQEPGTALSGEIEMLFDVFEDNLDMALQFQSTLGLWKMALAQQAAEYAVAPPGVDALEPAASPPA